MVLGFLLGKLGGEEMERRAAERAADGSGADEDSGTTGDSGADEGRGATDDPETTDGDGQG
jgi:hypothetical protein